MFESDISIEMLAIKEGYRYEYLGDCVQPVWYKTLEKTIYCFFTAFTMKYFPLLNGTFSCGKATALVETARLIAQNLVSRTITSISEPNVIEKVSSIYCFLIKIKKFERLRLIHLGINTFLTFCFFFLAADQWSGLFWLLALS